MVRRVVEQGRSFRSVAGEFGVATRTVSKWVKRYRAQGAAGLMDRSSRPHHSPRATSPVVLARIERLRRQRLSADRIARTCGVSPATVSRVLRRLGLNRVSMLEPPEPVRRYQRDHPGELIHLDIKKLRRFDRPGHRVTGNRRVKSTGVGWECLHVCIDDASRLAYAEFYSDERAESSARSLRLLVNELSLLSSRCHDRQWTRLYLASLQKRMQGTRTPPSSDPAISTTDKRQG